MKHIFKTLTIAVIFSCCFTNFAQNYSSGIGVLAGYSDNGYAGMINYNHYPQLDRYIQAGIYVSFNENEVRNIKIPYNNISLNVGYFKTIIDSGSGQFKISLGAGGVAGYEIINNGKETLSNGALIQDDSKFIYGAFGSAESDIYLNDDISIILKFNQFYHQNSDLGKFTIFAGVGIRYILF